MIEEWEKGDVVRFYATSGSGCETFLHAQDERYPGLRNGRSATAMRTWWPNPMLTQVPVRTETCR